MENQNHTPPADEQVQQDTVLAKTYPTAPDAEGYFTENEDDDVLGVQSKVYDNGNRVKRVPLSGGRTAMVRELTGRDARQARSIAAGLPGSKKGEVEPDDYIDVIAALSTRIDDKDIIAEDFIDLKMMDYNKLRAASQTLNFP